MDAAEHERFTRLWTQSQSAIAGYLAALVPDPHQADDLLQDIAIVLLRKFPAYDRTRPFIAWAMGITKMAIVTLHRDRARHLQRFRPDTITALAATWQDLLPEIDDRRQALLECLKSVDGRARQLVALRYHQDRTAQEIAQDLGMAAGAVRVALLRVRLALQACIERRLAVAGDRR